MSVLAVIPAKSRSQRCEGKNFRQLGWPARPMLEYTVEAAQRANCVDRAIVSTDAEWEPAPAWQKVDVWARPPELLGDEVSAIQVVASVLARATEEDPEVRAVIMLLPTAPLRTAAHIEAAFTLWESHGAEVPCVSVTPAPDLGRRLRVLSNAHGRLISTGREKRLMLLSNGAVQIASLAAFREGRLGFHHPAPVAYMMGSASGLDVDSEHEFLVADLLLRNQSEEK